MRPTTQLHRPGRIMFRAGFAVDPEETLHRPQDKRTYRPLANEEKQDEHCLRVTHRKSLEDGVVCSPYITHIPPRCDWKAIPRQPATARDGGGHRGVYLTHLGCLVAPHHRPHASSLHPRQAPQWDHEASAYSAGFLVPPSTSVREAYHNFLEQLRPYPAEMASSCFSYSQYQPTAHQVGSHSCHNATGRRISFVLLRRGRVMLPKS